MPEAETQAPAAKHKTTPTPKSKAPVIDARAFVVETARLLADDKCTNVVALDIRGLSQVTDFVVIGSGTSDRQMRSVIHHVAELGAGMGFRAFRSNVDERATWLLVDFVDVIVHVFEPNTRAHYDLEMLWGDAPRVEWERPSELPRNRAGLSRGDAVFESRG